MRTGRMRKTSKEMSKHFAAIQQGVGATKDLGGFRCLFVLLFQIAHAIRRQKLISAINRDMNTLIDNREKASRKRETYCKRLSNVILANTTHTVESEHPLRESITKLETTIAYLNSEISSCQQVLMTYDDDDNVDQHQHHVDHLQAPDPQLIVDCVNDVDELRYLLKKLIEQTIEKGFEADEANQLKSYVDLVETMLENKDEIKPTVKRLKKTNTDQDESLSSTIVLRPLDNSSNLIN